MNNEYEPELNEPVEGTLEENESTESMALVPIDEQVPPMAKCMAGMQTAPLADRTNEILLSAIDPAIVEIKPDDGIPYVPQGHYRRRLNLAFGPGMWNLIPVSDLSENDEVLSREWALFAHGRFFGKARGEQRYIPKNSKQSKATVTEGVKSSALKRCCKDLGIFWELSDPGWRAAWAKKNVIRVWVEHARDKSKKVFFRRVDRDPIDVYPWKEVSMIPSQPPTGNGQKQAPPPAPLESPKSEPVSTVNPADQKDCIEISQLCEKLGVFSECKSEKEKRVARLAFINQIGDYQPQIKSMKDLNAQARKILIGRLRFEIEQADAVYEATL